ncbi:hypothetical protein MRX96_010280 [Rhipicephalus microplus]
MTGTLKPVLGREITLRSLKDRVDLLLGYWSQEDTRNLRRISGVRATNQPHYHHEEVGRARKIYTDCLEDRLGKHRQLAVAQYTISIRAIYDVENKRSLHSTLPKFSPDQQWECVRKQVEVLLYSSNVVVTSEALTKMQDVLPVLVYSAGYAVFGILGS